MKFSILTGPLSPMLAAMDDERRLTRLDFIGQRTLEQLREKLAGEADEWTEDAPAFAGLARQLDEYFAGRRKSFEVEMAPHGTAFRQHVWAELCRIPYGETISYAELARRVGNVARAVGQANGSNPIAILIPCHRVIGNDGSLTGYASGVDIKRALLELEGALEPPLFAERLTVGHGA